MFVEIAFENAFNELLGFGAGDERAAIAVEFDSIEMSGSNVCIEEVRCLGGD